MSIVSASRDAEYAQRWLMEMDRYDSTSLLARKDLNMSQMDVKLATALLGALRGRLHSVVHRWMDLNPIAMFSGRAMLRFIDEQLSQDQQLEATSTLAEWMKMRPKGNSPEAVEEFILAWTGAYSRLYQMGQAPAQPMVKTLFIEKVEASAHFAQADFAVWRRIPSTDPSSTAEAFMELLLSRCKMIRQEAQYKEKDRNTSRAFVANQAKRKESKWKKAVYLSVPEDEDDVSGEWQEDQDEEWYEDGEEYADEEYAANVATVHQGKIRRKREERRKGKRFPSSKKQRRHESTEDFCEREWRERKQTFALL